MIVQHYTPEKLEMAKWDGTSKLHVKPISQQPHTPQKSFNQDISYHSSHNTHSFHVTF